jgi:hypothetical protein
MGVIYEGENHSISTNLLNLFTLLCRYYKYKYMYSIYKKLGIFIKKYQVCCNGNSVGPLGTASISHSLLTNVTLTELNLWANNTGQEGAASMAHSLITNVTLTELNSRNNYIGPEGATSTTHSLLTNATLTKLNLGENNIGPEGVVLMVGALKNNFKLTKIIIDGANH